MNKKMKVKVNSESDVAQSENDDAIENLEYSSDSRVDEDYN
jgi:hypothetical protein